MAALAGKAAIVTGASSGLGASTARALAREGGRWESSEALARSGSARVVRAG